MAYRKYSRMLLFFFLALQAAFFAQSPVFYVSPGGDDAGNGSLTAPWKTIQKAANTAVPGSVVFVRSGVYFETVSINVSGNSAQGTITFANYPGETPIIDGTGRTVPSSDNALMLITDRSFITIDGFELRNYRTSTKNRVPVGIFITGTAHHINIRNCNIHHIEHNGTSSSGTDAHGIAVYGSSGTSSIHNLVIEGNTLSDLKLGSSEALVLNGNVEFFSVLRNNIHHCNNIGIDAIGFEGTAPSNDQARNGVIAQNTVSYIDSYGNPAYGTDRSADGIYIDGGRDIIIERNVVHHANIGIELASEHSGKATSNITMRSNFIYLCDIAGIAIGGYDTQRGRTENCRILNNTLVQNDRLMQGNGEFMIQYDTRNTVIKNNIVYANSQNLMMSNDYTANTGNVVDFNLYYSPGGAGTCSFQWKKIMYYSYQAYKAGTGNDGHSLFINPGIQTNPPDFHISANSPALNAGAWDDSLGQFDLDNQPRVIGPVDIGADELGGSVAVRNERTADTGLTLSCYPNPANPVIRFIISAPRSGFACLGIYDLAGQQVLRIADEWLEPGQTTYTVSTVGLPSGVYFYLLSFGKGIYSGLLTVMK